jgi:DNA-binding Lrp family transcriptional regulator
MRDHWLVGFGQPVMAVDEDRGSFSRSEAWIDLIMECRYAAGTVNNGGRKMELRPGQLLGAVSWLANRWNWTPKTVRGFLDRLEEEGMIERFTPGIHPGSDDVLNGHQRGKQKGKQASVLTVCKYSVYQLAERLKGQAKGQAEGTQGASRGQAEGNIYKDNKGTKEQGNNPTYSQQIDDRELEKQLLEACNGALDNPVNCQGLLAMIEPKMWMREGCDLDLDILPALRAVGAKNHGRRINTWRFFTNAVAQAKATRLAGLPDVSPAPSAKRDKAADERRATLQAQRDKIRKENGWVEEGKANG